MRLSPYSAKAGDSLADVLRACASGAASVSAAPSSLDRRYETVIVSAEFTPARKLRSLTYRIEDATSEAFSLLDAGWYAFEEFVPEAPWKYAFDRQVQTGYDNEQPDIPNHPTYYVTWTDWGLLGQRNAEVLPTDWDPDSAVIYERLGRRTTRKDGLRWVQSAGGVDRGDFLVLMGRAAGGGLNVELSRSKAGNDVSLYYGQLEAPRGVEVGFRLETRFADPRVNRCLGGEEQRRASRFLTRVLGVQLGGAEWSALRDG